jgi:hypothetical protein
MFRLMFWFAASCMATVVICLIHLLYFLLWEVKYIAHLPVDVQEMWDALFWSEVTERKIT